MITKEELEICRTPSELKAFVDSKNAQINACSDERSKAREKTGIYRWYRDEVIPIAEFSFVKFDDNVKIKPINGNQGYDAEVYDINGKLLFKIELCVPIMETMISYKQKKLTLEDTEIHG